MVVPSAPIQINKKATPVTHKHSSICLSIVKVTVIIEQLRLKERLETNLQQKNESDQLNRYRKTALHRANWWRNTWCANARVTVGRSPKPCLDLEKLPCDQGIAVLPRLTSSNLSLKGNPMIPFSTPKHQADLQVEFLAHLSLLRRNWYSTRSSHRNVAPSRLTKNWSISQSKKFLLTLPWMRSKTSKTLKTPPAATKCSKIGRI